VGGGDTRGGVRSRSGRKDQKKRTPGEDQEEKEEKKLRKIILVCRTGEREPEVTGRAERHTEKDERIMRAFEKSPQGWESEETTPLEAAGRGRSGEGND